MPGTPIIARSIAHWPSAEAYARLEHNKQIVDHATAIINAGGLAIFGAGATTVKTVNQIDFMVNGILASLAAATMPVLAGTIATNFFGGWVFTVSVAGVVTARFMTQGATLAAVVMPAVPAGDCVIGYVRLNPTTAPFVGGTTLLDAANTNAIYRDATLGMRALFSSGTGTAAIVTSPVGQ